jgi:hypothetical protein
MRVSHSIVPYGRASYEHVFHGHISHVQVSHERASHGRVSHLRVFLARRTRVVRIPISTLRMFLRLLIVGDSAVQAADHPWRALRVVKSCRKDPRGCPKPKQQLCIQNGARAHYLNYLPKREDEAGKRSVRNRIGQPIRSTEKVKDRQVENRPMSAGAQVDRQRPK